MCMQPVTALVRLSLTAIHRCFALLPAPVPFLALGMGSGWEGNQVIANKIFEKQKMPNYCVF